MYSDNKCVKAMTEFRFPMPFRLPEPTISFVACVRFGADGLFMDFRETNYDACILAYCGTG